MKTALLEAGAMIAVGVAAGLAYNALAADGLYASVEEVVGPREIDVATAQRLLDEGALFVDARFWWDYEAGHVPGALSLPVTEAGHAPELLGDVPRDRLLVTYCTGPPCDSGDGLARALMREHGYRRVRVMTAGWPGWVAAGYAVERRQGHE